MNKTSVRLISSMFAVSLALQPITALARAEDGSSNNRAKLAANKTSPDPSTLNLDEANKPELALRNFTRAIELDPSPNNYANRADFHFKREEWQAAIDDYTQAINRNIGPPIDSHIIRLASAEAVLHEYAEAEKLLTDYMGKMPSNVTLIGAYGRLLEKQKKYAQALACVNRAMSEHPNERVLMKIKASLLCSDGQYEEAKRAADALIQKWPDDPYGYQIKTDVAEKQNDFANQIAAYTTLIEKFPKDSSYRSDRARAYSKLGQYENARADLLVALKLTPNDAETLYSLARNDEHLGQLSEALRDVDKALKLDSDEPGYWHYCAFLLFICNQYSEAAETLSHVLSPSVWKEDDLSMYCAFWSYFSYLKLGNQAMAQKVLNDVPQKSDWPSPIKNYLLGRLTEEQLMALPKDADEKTEAHTYIAMKNLQDGHRERAQTAIQWVLQNGSKSTYEYLLCVALHNPPQAKLSSSELAAHQQLLNSVSGPKPVQKSETPTSQTTVTRSQPAAVHSALTPAQPRPQSPVAHSSAGQSKAQHIQPQQKVYTDDIFRLHK